MFKNNTGFLLNTSACDTICANRTNEDKGDATMENSSFRTTVNPNEMIGVADFLMYLIKQQFEIVGFRMYLVEPNPNVPVPHEDLGFRVVRTRKRFWFDSISVEYRYFNKHVIGNPYLANTYLWKGALRRFLNLAEGLKVSEFADSRKLLVAFLEANAQETLTSRIGEGATSIRWQWELSI